MTAKQTLTATAPNGEIHTYTGKVAYTHVRFTGPVDWDGPNKGQFLVSYHKSEKAAATGSHQTPAWNHLPRTVVPFVQA